jgi:uncharacterized protein YaaR (DUF327 family)
LAPADDYHYPFAMGDCQYCGVLIEENKMPTNKIPTVNLNQGDLSSFCGVLADGVQSEVQALVKKIVDTVNGNLTTDSLSETSGEVRDEGEADLSSETNGDVRSRVEAVDNYVKELEQKRNKARRRTDAATINTIIKQVNSALTKVKEAIRSGQEGAVSLQTVQETLLALIRQQKLIKDNEGIQEKLQTKLSEIASMQHLSSQLKPSVFISYTPAEDKELEPFLQQLSEHLSLAGFKVSGKMSPGENPIEVMRNNINLAEHILLVCTPSLKDQQLVGVISNMLGLIATKYKNDKQFSKPSPVYPVLISGTPESSRPDKLESFSDIEPQLPSANYLKFLQTLLYQFYGSTMKEHIYGSTMKKHIDDAFLDILKEFESIKAEVEEGVEEGNETTRIEQQKAEVQQKYAALIGRLFSRSTSDGPSGLNTAVPPASPTPGR